MMTSTLQHCAVHAAEGPLTAMMVAKMKVAKMMVAKMMVAIVALVWTQPTELMTMGGMDVDHIQTSHIGVETTMMRTSLPMKCAAHAVEEALPEK